MERIAIMGAGSLGTILGAYIAKGGKDITLVDANQEHVNALNEKGAKVIGFTEMTVPVHAVTPENMEGISGIRAMESGKMQKGAVYRHKSRRRKTGP